MPVAYLKWRVGMIDLISILAWVVVCVIIISLLAIGIHDWFKYKDYS